MVASTSVAEYYTRYKYAKTLNNSKYTDIFCSMVLLGFGTEAYSGKDTISSRLYKVIKAYYKMYNKSGYGKYISSGVDKKVTSYNNKKKPVVGHFKAPNKEGHARVMAGYYDVTITYKKKKNSKEQTKTIRYYAVNDGWNTCTSGDACLSYIRSDYLKNGITVFK